MVKDFAPILLNLDYRSKVWNNYDLLVSSAYQHCICLIENTVIL